MIHLFVSSLLIWLESHFLLAQTDEPKLKLSLQTALLAYPTAGGWSAWATLLLVGLQSVGLAQQTRYDTLTHDGLERVYILYVPASYTGSDSVPLVFSFHGAGGTAQYQMESYDFRPMADSAGFLVAYPQGAPVGPGVAVWNIGTDTTRADDIGFVQAMIDSLSGRYNINRDRVYATGMSMGGFLSIHLAGRLSGEIAAIAAVAGTMTQGMYESSAPVHPTPLLQIHGTSDPLVPYGGNPVYWSVDEVLDYWIAYNHCDAVPTITQLPDLAPNDGSTVEHIVYGNGDLGATVEHLKVTGGSHAWPGSTDGRPGTNFDIDASAEIWKFFSRYDIYGLINETVGIEDHEEQRLHSVSQFQAYPNPFHAQTTIRFTLYQPAKVSLTIYDNMGRRIATLLDEPKASGTHSLTWEGTDASGGRVNAGMYFYRLETDTFGETKSMLLIR
jgi:polyhydroxybutyrate depolymerase